MVIIYDSRFDMDEVESYIRREKPLSEDLLKKINESMHDRPDFIATLRKKVWGFDNENNSLIKEIYERAALIKIITYDSMHNIHAGLAKDPSGIFLLKGPFINSVTYDLQHTCNHSEGKLDDEWGDPYRWLNREVLRGIVSVAELVIEPISNISATLFLFDIYCKNNHGWVQVYNNPKVN